MFFILFELFIIVLDSHWLMVNELTTKMWVGALGNVSDHWWCRSLWPAIIKQNINLVIICILFYLLSLLIFFAQWRTKFNNFRPYHIWLEYPWKCSWFNLFFKIMGIEPILIFEQVDGNSKQLDIIIPISTFHILDNFVFVLFIFYEV